MKITKYEHACLVVEEDGMKLVIDPGVYSKSYTDFSSVAGVVITHVHADHLDPSKLKAIYETNPGVQFFGTQEVADEAKGSFPVQVVKEGESLKVGNFSLDFLAKITK